MNRFFLRAGVCAPGWMLAVCLAAVCACTASATEIDPNDLSAANALGGPEVLAAIKGAETVTAQRVDSEVAESKESAPEHPVLIMLGEPFPVPAAMAGELRKAFSTGTTFLGPSKVCEFRANVRYAFLAPGREPVEIILCFGCGEMEVRRGDRVVAFGPFDEGYGTLLDITKRIFPDDKFLAAFSEADFIERSTRLRRARTGPSVPP